MSEMFYDTDEVYDLEDRVKEDEKVEFVIEYKIKRKNSGSDTLVNYQINTNYGNTKEESCQSTDSETNISLSNATESITPENVVRTLSSDTDRGIESSIRCGSGKLSIRNSTDFKHDDETFDDFSAICRIECEN